MMMHWHETWIITLVILLELVSDGIIVEGLRGSELVLAAKAKAAEQKANPTTEEITVLVNEDGTNQTVVKAKPLLTGIPQKDYIHDPNLPRELKGHNLTNYPFYNAVPNDIEFECDGLHDGFYASVPHRCQLYHHCLFGTRYDFLCANYTAFDQKTFICHFVSEVDCENSPKYYKRNEALYKQSSSSTPTTTQATTKATTTVATSTTSSPNRKPGGGRRRRPPTSYRRRRPIYEYYYDDDYDEEYYDDDVDDEEVEPAPMPPPRKHSSSSSRRYHQRNHSQRKDNTPTTTTTTTTASPPPQSADAPPLTRAPLSVYAPRVLPKINRPVPINEKSRYDYTTKANMNVIKPTKNPLPVGRRGAAGDDNGYEDDGDDIDDEETYYDDVDDEYEEEIRTSVKKKSQSGKTGRRRAQQPERKRPPIRYDDYDEEDEEEIKRPPPRMRKRNRKGGAGGVIDTEGYRGRPRGGGTQTKRRKGSHRGEESDPIPSERPGYISGRPLTRKRYEDERPKKADRWQSPEYEYEYDEEEDTRYEMERRRPTRVKTEKMRPRSVKKATTTTSTTTSTTPSTTTTKTTTTTTTTTSTTTKKPTTQTPTSLEEENEYEEYEEQESEEVRMKSQSDEGPGTVTKSTETLHHFTKPTYKNYSRTIQTTTEAITRQKTQPVTYRRSKFELKRNYTKPVDTQPSLPQSKPGGFVKPEGENRSKPVETSPLARRPPSYSFEEPRIRKLPKPVEPVNPQLNTGEIPNQSDNFQKYGSPISAPEGPINILTSKQPEQPLRKFTQKPDFPFPVTALGRRPIQEGQYRNTFPRPGIFSPTGPDAIYKRPSAPPPTETGRAPPSSEGFLIRKVPIKSENYPLSFPTAFEEQFRRPFNTQLKKDLEDQNRRPFNQQQQQQEQSIPPESAERRPLIGVPITAAGYRRGYRPIDNDKKTDIDLAYNERKTTTTTTEPITEIGPNYRNPFSFARPIKEENNFFKPPKSVDFTAPGPSGSGGTTVEASTQRTLPIYDIAEDEEEEYDVTLNDALQPSTLNPTLQYARLKSRGSYQTTVTHPSYHPQQQQQQQQQQHHHPHQHSLILPSASQTYYNKAPVQSAPEDYETVVLPAATRYTQPGRYKQRRPAEWYW